MAISKTQLEIEINRLKKCKVLIKSGEIDKAKALCSSKKIPKGEYTVESFDFLITEKEKELKQLNDEVARRKQESDNLSILYQKQNELRQLQQEEKRENERELTRLRWYWDHISDSIRDLEDICDLFKKDKNDRIAHFLFRKNFGDVGDEYNNFDFAKELLNYYNKKWDDMEKATKEE